jgi:hypothetical protein
MTDFIVKIRIDGVQPTLMHCNQATNPLNPFAKKMKAIQNKRKKTDEDHEALLRLDWEAGLYYDEKIGVYIPSTNIEAMLRDAAKKLKKGTDVKQSVRVFPNEIPLIYSGPRELEKLKEIAFSGVPVNGEAFCDIRPVKIGTSTISRARPRFNRWALEFEIEADDAVFNMDDIIQILHIAGTKIGMSDYRPRYGTFEVKVLKQPS